MMTALSATEHKRWTAWKRATEAVMSAVEAEIADASGLSSADFSVLTRVVELGDGSLRQQELAELLGWQRSRLSRQLTRMQERGLVVREERGAARHVAATAVGRRAVADARPAHAAAVRTALLQQVPRAQLAEFWAVVDRLG